MRIAVNLWLYDRSVNPFDMIRSLDKDYYTPVISPIKLASDCLDHIIKNYFIDKNVINDMNFRQNSFYQFRLQKQFIQAVSKNVFILNTLNLFLQLFDKLAGFYGNEFVLQILCELADYIPQNTSVNTWLRLDNLERIDTLGKVETRSSSLNVSEHPAAIIEEILRYLESNSLLDSSENTMFNNLKVCY